MNLGAFSTSLAVKDLAVSKAFYEKLGFETVGGNAEQNWLILKNRGIVIGLFQGMFDANILTFNPGWEGLGEPAESYTDVRELRDRLVAAGIELSSDTTAEAPSGPASFTVADPDGNVILFDQHV